MLRLSAQWFVPTIVIYTEVFMGSWFSIAVLMILPALAAAVHIARKGRMDRLKKKRKAVDLAEIFSSTYSTSMDWDVFMKVWGDVSHCLNVDPLYLRPEDRFGVDVGVGGMTSEDIDELGERAEKHAEGKKVEIDLGKIKTVHDYVSVVGGLLMK